MPPVARQRAAKACRRCSKRKVKCDAAATGTPCSRCRMDGCTDCELIESFRGKYLRTARHRRQHGSETFDPAIVSTGPNSDDSDDRSPSNSSGQTSIQKDGFKTSFDGEPGRSLAGMFEDFVEDRDHGGLGIILFGEASPLTFALEEHSGDRARFYDARPTLAENKTLVDKSREVHPPHCSPEDIAYLQAKGAFTPPNPETLEALFDAFMTRFYPLYSIINRSELLEAYNRKTLPWIMLHAICMIGATFCDPAVIHRTTFTSRSKARQAYYGKVSGI